MATVSGGALGHGVEWGATVTRDALFGGSVVLYQPARGAGYRTNVDALLLAAFAIGRGAAPIAFDLGAGVGAVGLTLLRLGGARRVVLVEIDGVPAAMARRNLDANGWTSQGEVVRGDVRDVALARRGEASLVVCNPPYVAPGAGRPAKGASRALARSGKLGTFVDAARTLAGRRARVCFVYPAREAQTLLATLSRAGLEPKRMRAVHASTDTPARIVLVEAQPAKPGGLVIVPPLFERSAHGYTDEISALLARS
jgi:tRNA1Val (adenine37-N6)-methyltransferase